MNQYVPIPRLASATWCAPVDSLSDLPTSGNKEGDVRVTLDSQSLYLWDSAAWVEVSGGGGGGGNAFTIVQTPTGTSPTATTPTSVLDLLTANGYLSILGSSVDDSVLFTVTPPVEFAANVGAGAGEVFKQLNGTDLEFKTIKAGSGVTVTNGASDITIASSGLSITGTDNSIVRVDGTTAVQDSGLLVDDVASLQVVTRTPDENNNNATNANSVLVRGGNKTAGALAIGGHVGLAAGRNTTQSASNNWYGGAYLSADGDKTQADVDGGKASIYGFDTFRIFLRSFSSSVDIVRFTTSRFLLRCYLGFLDAGGSENVFDIGQNSGGSFERPRRVQAASFVGVACSSTTPTASTALEVGGTTGAVLFPRLTTTQRDALTATNGMVVYNSSTDKLQVRAAGAWVDLH